jgi:pimeloyl-ACP methyl ester carboxylesterase
MRAGFVEIAGAARIHYREAGAGPPLVILHGGWGYEIFPFDRQIEALAGRCRIVIPDRSGYGRSPKIEDLPVDFHRRAAEETLHVLDALEIGQAALWGHSDGAVIGAMLGLAAPQRFRGLILEAFHYSKIKKGSMDFFHVMISDPDSVGERAAAALERDHGAGWRGVLKRNAEAWIEIAKTGPGDLYGGKLSELKPPALFIDGGRDPRTEPGDLEAVRRALPGAEMRRIEGAGHSPHSEPAQAAECTRLASGFLDCL